MGKVDVEFSLVKVAIYLSLMVVGKFRGSNKLYHDQSLDQPRKEKQKNDVNERAK